MGKWAELSSTARLSQPVTKSEQSPAVYPLAKMSYAAISLAAIQRMFGSTPGGIHRMSPLDH